MRNKHWLVLVLLVGFGYGCQSIQPITTSPQESAKSMLLHAEKLYKNRQFEQAAIVYNRILQVDPSSTKSLYRLGNIAFRQDDPDSASAFYKRVISLDPRHSRAQYNLAMSHLSLAEKHLKFYTATAQESADLQIVTKIVNFLNNLSDDSQKVNPASTLELLTDQLIEK